MPPLPSSALPIVDDKQLVAEFWERGSCGEVYAAGETMRAALAEQARARYALEPYIPGFASFASGRGAAVLEVGIGMGADHLEWAKHRPRRLVGVDLTRRAVDFTRERLALEGYTANVQVADAERLPFPERTFDIVYSWGVLHHSPNTEQAIAEVWRVLRPGGRAAIMIYHRDAVVGYLLWLRYALARGRPLTSLTQIYGRYLESPGTKAYTVAQAREMFRAFAAVRPSVQLSCGDLLEGAAGARHQGRLLSAAQKLWPRPIIRRLFARHGLFLLIDAIKPA